MEKKPSYDELVDRVEELEESVSKYRSLAENASDLLYRTDAEGKIIYLSKSVYELAGYSMEEAIGLDMARDVYLIAEEREQFLSILKRDGKVRNFEARLKRKDGSVWWASTNACFFYDRDGGIGGVEGIARDITEYKSAEEKLFKQAQRIKVFFDSLGDAIFVHPLKEEGFAPFEEVNNVACERYGYSYDEFLQLSGPDITQRSDADAHSSRNHRRELREKGHLVFETVHIKRTGERFPVEVNSNIIHEDGKPYILAVVRDISERKNIEAHLMKIKQLEAITTLSEGVAHEFNNALNVVTGNIELLKMTLTDHEAVNSFDQQVTGSIQRLQRLTKRLHAYARGGKYKAEIVNLNDILKSISPAILSRSDANMLIDTDLSGHISMIKADVDQLQVVLSAVFTNASEAGAEHIHIRTAEREIDETFASSHWGITPGNYVVLTIEDNGKGMDEGTKNRIFDPFFTTKFQGRGLDMAAVYGIIKNHNGYIYIDSELGKGTIVRILMPPIKGE